MTRPRHGAPPYQTVIHFPSSASFAQRSSQDLETYIEFTFFLAPLVKSGRAVLYPVYKGTFERGSNELFAIHGGPSTHQYTAFFVKVVQDFRRCIDYLQQESPEIDGQHFAYCGLSTGGSYGTIITAVEDRLGASVLAVGGMSGNGRPEVNPINYAGRVNVPTLMLSGKYDLNIPYETRVKPMFDLLGTLVNNDEKDLKLYETDHFIPYQGDPDMAGPPSRPGQVNGRFGHCKAPMSHSRLDGRQHKVAPEHSGVLRLPPSTRATNPASFRIAGEGPRGPGENRRLSRSIHQAVLR